MTDLADNKKTIPLVKLFYRAYGSYKRKIAVLTIIGFLSGLAEAVGINAIIPLFSFISGGGGKTVDTISAIVESFFNFLHIPYSFRYLIMFIVALFIVRSMLLIIANYMRISIAADYEQTMRNIILGRAMRSDWPFLMEQKLGHLETLLMTNIRFAEKTLSVVSAMMIAMASLLMFVLVAINISLPVTIATLGLGAALLLLFKPFLGKTKKYATQVEEINRNTAHHINQTVVGMKTIKAASVADNVEHKGKGYFNRLRNLKVKISFLQILPSTLMQPVGVLFVVAIFAFSYKLPGFNLAAFAAIIYLVQRISIYTQQIQSSLHQLYETAPYLRELLKFEEAANQHRESDAGSKPFSFKESVVFENLRFSYTDDTAILNDVSFSIKRGEMIGFIGQSGSGKTTIADLILRLFKPNGGTIRVDGTPLSEIKLRAWRSSIGYVSQDIFLLNDTIAENIRFYSDTITEEDIVAGSKMANIYDFIQTLPKGFDTVVGERGVMLSGGQRQRIAIARALAHKPEILIFDEATNQLDNESEFEIQQVVESLRGRLTIMVIAHRLSTILNSDTVHVLEKGKIVESGDPQKLIAKKDSHFHRMYEVKK